MILSILVLLLLSLSGPAWSSIASAGDGGDGATPPSTAGCDLLLDGGWLVRSLAGPWLWLSCSSRTTTTAATTTTTTTAASIITAKEAPLLPSASALLLLEPIVTLRTGVLPRNACESLIALGEKASFPHEGESIDEYQDREYKVSSQSIEVYERESESTVVAVFVVVVVVVVDVNVSCLFASCLLDCAFIISRMSAVLNFLADILNTCILLIKPIITFRIIQRVSQVPPSGKPCCPGYRR